MNTPNPQAQPTFPASPNSPSPGNPGEGWGEGCRVGIAHLRDTGGRCPPYKRTVILSVLAKDLALKFEAPALSLSKGDSSPEDSE